MIVRLVAKLNAFPIAERYHRFGPTGGFAVQAINGGDINALLSGRQISSADRLEFEVDIQQDGVALIPCTEFFTHPGGDTRTPCALHSGHEGPHRLDFGKKV